MVGFGEVVAFDPEQIRDIFTVCSAQQKTCDALSGHVKKLSDLDTWEGDAATAAKNAAGKMRVDIDSHGLEVWKVAAAARDCYDEAVTLKNAARQVQADADAAHLVIDPVTGTVSDPAPPNMHGWADADKQTYYDEINAMQLRVNAVIVDAERFDDDLAAAINAADGSLTLTPTGEGDNVNLADRRANQVAAFQKMFGREPLSETDWRTASSLDPHSYLSKNNGLNAEVRVIKIEPLKGKGDVRMNLFIPSKNAFNFPGADDLGDHRGFDPSVSPEHSRVSAIVDYENGIVVLRQNPSVSIDGESSVAEPDASVAQAKDGTVYLRYSAYNPNVAGGEAGARILAHTANGSVAIQPTASGMNFAGTQSDFPQAEVYWDSGSDKGTLPLAQFVPTHTGSTGALTDMMTSHAAGDESLMGQFQQSRVGVGYPGSGASHIEIAPTTPLGSVDDPPTAKTVKPLRP